MVKIKNNEIKENIINFALVNNTAQANTEINNNLNVKNEIKLKIGPIKLIEAIWGNKVLDYIVNYELKKQNCFSTINHKIQEKIPKENYEEPRVNIVGPVVDNLKYNLDEEHIKELFTNLLVSEMDDRKQNKVLPAYCEIIKQLSSEDAKFLKRLKEINEFELTFIHIIADSKNHQGYKDLEKVLINSKPDMNFLCTQIMSDIVLDNLERLQIIKVDALSIIPRDEEVAKDVFERYKRKYIDNSDFVLTYRQGALTITEFGQQFIDICCS